MKCSMDDIPWVILNEMKNYSFSMYEKYNITLSKELYRNLGLVEKDFHYLNNHFTYRIVGDEGINISITRNFL